MKINNILLILISLLISIPSMANKMKNESLSEQQDSKIQDRQNTFWEMLVRNASIVNATGKPYPEANNWTLSYTGTYGQYTCKHYEHNGRGLRVYYKKDGSFITLPESSSGSNAPSDYYVEGWLNTPWGDR